MQVVIVSALTIAACAVVEVVGYTFDGTNLYLLF